MTKLLWSATFGSKTSAKHSKVFILEGATRPLVDLFCQMTPFFRPEWAIFKIMLHEWKKYLCERVLKESFWKWHLLKNSTLSTAQKTRAVSWETTTLTSYFQSLTLWSMHINFVCENVWCWFIIVPSLVKIIYEHKRYGSEIILGQKVWLADWQMDGQTDNNSYKPPETLIVGGLKQPSGSAP